MSARSGCGCSARVVVYFVLALAIFERSCYQAVWAKLTAGLGSVPVARPCPSSLARARRRLGSGPLRHLFSILAGPVADHRQDRVHQSPCAAALHEGHQAHQRVAESADPADVLAKMPGHRFLFGSGQGGAVHGDQTQALVERAGLRTRRRRRTLLRAPSASASRWATAYRCAG